MKIMDVCIFSGERRREGGKTARDRKGEGRREKGEGRREKGEGRREKIRRAIVRSTNIEIERRKFEVVDQTLQYPRHKGKKNSISGTNQFS